MQIFLTVAELGKRIKYARQTIYNYIHNKTFVLNRHYYKPTPKKILFIWPAIEEWLKEKGADSVYHAEDETETDDRKKPSTPDHPKSLINI